MSNLIGTFETNMSKSKKYTGRSNRFSAIRLNHWRNWYFKNIAFGFDMWLLLTVSVAIDVAISVAIDVHCMYMHMYICNVYNSVHIFLSVSMQFWLTHCLSYFQFAAGCERCLQMMGFQEFWQKMSVKAFYSILLTPLVCLFLETGHTNWLASGNHVGVLFVLFPSKIDLAWSSKNTTCSLINSTSSRM